MFICIDAGNTRTKVYIFDGQGEVRQRHVFRENVSEPIRDLAQSLPDAHLILSASGQIQWSPADIPVTGVKIALGPDTRLPLRIVYATPQTLGRDRIAGACGAHALLPGRTCLVVDAGTCITLDLVLPSGIFLGGNIAPGISMRLTAMHEHTARLPLVPAGWPVLPWGDSTEHALQNGACLGALREIEQTWLAARNAYPDVALVLTGGDAPLLAERWQNQIFVAPDLVARGLYEILQFHVASAG